MTNKEQIIIDGVDVLKEKINMCFILLLNKLETPETIEQTIYEHLNAFVKEWSTQLAHKTQECESLKEEVQILQDNFNTVTRDCNDLIDELRQECEELKDYARRQENQREVYYKEFLKKAKVLEEIEKHIESYKEQCNIPNNCVDNRLCSTCFLGGANELGEYILDIINKVKGEGNE